MGSDELTDQELHALVRGLKQHEALAREEQRLLRERLPDVTKWFHGTARNHPDPPDELTDEELRELVHRLEQHEALAREEQRLLGERLPDVMKWLDGAIGIGRSDTAVSKPGTVVSALAKHDTDSSWQRTAPDALAPAASIQSETKDSGVKDELARTIGWPKT